jgi:acetyltransferase-like isoleucine patch superfamily enzyme
MPDVVIGANCNIGDHCFIESGAIIGDNVTIKNGNMIWERCNPGRGCFRRAARLLHKRPLPSLPRLIQAQARYRDHQWLCTTLVKRGATLGAGAVILADHTIGEFAMIGAGAVVTRDVPPYALVTGNPARVKNGSVNVGNR